MQRGPTSQPIPIGQPVALKVEDLEKLKAKRHVPPTPQKLRDSHHMVARLTAAGNKPGEVAALTGYTRERITSLLASPAMEELVAQYRLKVDEAFVENQDTFFALATSNMLAAERHISDAIAEAEDAGELIPIRTALAISRDAADRFGYGKKSQQTNINVDFASALEKAIARSGKTLEGGGATSSSVQGPPQGADRPRHLLEPSVVGPANPPQRMQLVGSSDVSSRPSQASTRQLVDQPRPSIRRRA